MEKIFLTGMMRSGTTLLQRALNQHPDIVVSYQGKTEHFLKKIKLFHEQHGVNRYHLLSHYSPSDTYTFQDLQWWLNKELTVDELLPESDSLCSGVKEVLAEEFLPFFVSNQIKCINIVRDPRDVIASMSFGEGIEHTGLERPVLFDIKNWRKSVLISQLLKESPYLLTIRMEDLLIAPQKTMEKIYLHLGVDNFSFTRLAEAMNTSTWKGNSSFGEKKAFDTSAIGNYKEVLPSSVVEYIETTCSKEMDCMGYQKSNLHLNVNLISSYVDPFKCKRHEFVDNYSSSTENTAYESARYQLSLKEVLKQEFGGI